MTQFDPSMVAQMLMQPIQRASENLGGAPFGIGADAGGSYFVDPEVAARTGYGTAVTGTSFFPGAGIVDAAGGAVDVTGQPLPSFSENIRQGNYLDATLQGLGVAGDVATVAAPATLGTSLVLASLLKAPGAIRKTTNVADVASDVSKVVETPKSIEQTLSQKYPDIDISVFENQNGLTLSKIVVPENQRSEGIGTKVMDDLIDYADKNNLSIGVTPDATFGGSKTRLESFYKKFGFVRNKGRNKDFTFRETFVRQPSDVNVAGIAKPTTLFEDLQGRPIPVNEDGTITVYHRTNSSVNDIIESDGFFSKENTPEIFVSNKPDGQIVGYGENVIELKIDQEDLQLNDVFSDEAHFTVPIEKANKALSQIDQKSNVAKVEPPTDSSKVKNEKMLDKPKNPKNLLKYKGKETWGVIVDNLDNEVIGTVPFEKAQAADFHHSFYMSPKFIKKIDDGDYSLYVDNGDGFGLIEGRGEKVPPAVKKRILEQVEYFPKDD